MSGRWAARATVFLAMAGLFIGAGVASADTLKTVRDRGKLVCGVNQGLSGFAAQDAQGAWSGFDVDYCKAIAAAVLGDASKVDYVPLSASERFDALRGGKIDVLARNSTWTLDREAASGLMFTGINYHDGQGFMVIRRPAVTSALELDGASVCVQSGTTSEANLADFFRANAMTLKVVPEPSPAEALKAFEGGTCDVLTADQSALFAQRLQLAKPGDATILPDVISKEPLGPVVRADDVAWFTIVKWVHFALVNAEELGISSATVGEAMASKKPDVLRFVGAEGGFGARLGLDAGFAIAIVKAVGNYGEVFERNLGVTSPLGIPRGLNHLWSMGGIIYAPPMR
ncbi:MAG: amino acid ABC transporter substrate-binding protein [Labrys sp. (in: a-proteobacteria)]